MKNIWKPLWISLTTLSICVGCLPSKGSGGASSSSKSDEDKSSGDSPSEAEYAAANDSYDRHALGKTLVIKRDLRMEADHNYSRDLVKQTSTERSIFKMKTAEDLSTLQYE